MNAFEWATNKQGIMPPSEFYCQTSDVWQGRFTKVAPLLIKQGVDQKLAALIAAVIGEIGDNCFAHNAPSWIDVSGCWFEWAIDKNKIKFVIADRGRGIFASLKIVRPELATHSDALGMALTERVSGRAPEKRGNGLKFIVDALHTLRGGEFLIHTGDAKFQVALPLDRSVTGEYINVVKTNIQGVYSELTITYAS